MARPLLICLVLLAATPASGRVLDSAPDGFTLENSAVVPVTPNAAYAALVNDVGRWWPADHSWFGRAENFSIEARAGGCFCETDGPRQVSHMRIAHVNPGKLLRMLGGLGPLQGMGLHGALDWVFEAVEDGTKITLRYRVGGYTPDSLAEFAPVVDQVQASQLGRLAAFLQRKR
mgnify:CR=1 FL=1